MDTEGEGEGNILERYAALTSSVVYLPRMDRAGANGYSGGKHRILRSTYPISFIKVMSDVLYSDRKSKSNSTSTVDLPLSLLYSRLSLPLLYWCSYSTAL
jgi:hypothetical protein